MNATAKKQHLLESLDRGPGTVWRNELEGGIVQEGTGRAGVPHGPFRQWFPQGQLRLERNYRAGELDGVCRQYSADGKLLAEFTMSAGDGLLLEYWDTGKLKIRWWQFHLHDRHCGIMELFDVDGAHPMRVYTWKGRPCRTRKRFLAELEKCGLMLPSADKMTDAGEWAKFAEQARGWTPPTKKRN